jgi:GNAT superfamily N-acetyltransferase
MGVLRPCSNSDRANVLAVINLAAERYRGAIPADRWRVPYMPAAELAREIAAGVAFHGYFEGERLLGVMGIQPVADVHLIRHAYVQPEAQGRGIGGRLLQHFVDHCPTRMLVGTWAAATWAIGFYQRHGFVRVDAARTPELLGRYWNIPARQVETSVVLSRAPA